jgi:hypothetical protein
MGGEPPLNLADTGQCLVPAQFEFRRRQTVGGIGRVVLPESAISGVARRFEITA